MPKRWQLGMAFALLSSCTRREATPDASVETGEVEAGPPSLQGFPGPGPTFEAPTKIPPTASVYPYWKGDIPRAPHGTATPGAVEVIGGQVATAERVIAGMRPGFRACYNRGLVADAEQRGKLDVLLDLGPNGEVTGATAQRTGRMNDDTAECVLHRTRTATFPAPIGFKVSVHFSVTFEQ